LNEQRYCEKIAKPYPVWNQAQGTMRDMMGLVNQAQGSQMLAYLQQYKDLNSWLQSNGGYYNPAAIQQGYALQKSTNDTALQMAQAQRTALLNDVQRFQGLQSAAGSADGANKLLSYANQIAAEQTLQLMQMRALCNQMLEEAAARDAALANRRALMDVFGCHLKNKDNKMLQHFHPRKRAPLCAVA